MTERICLFGGTFDPIHNAHLEIARRACERFSLTRTLFVPSGNPPHKGTRSITPYCHRLRMVELACEGHPAFEASDLERGNEYSYTIDTLEKFSPSLPPEANLFFLIGSDAFDEIESWKRWTDVLSSVNFIVAARPGFEYRTRPGSRVDRLDDLALPVSSSAVRERLRLREPTPELPISVRRYIDENGLYL